MILGIVTEKFDFVVVYFVVHLIGAAGREYLTSNGVGRTYSDFSAHRRALWEPKAIATESPRDSVRFERSVNAECNAMVNENSAKLRNKGKGAKGEISLLRKIGFSTLPQAYRRNIRGCVLLWCDYHCT